MIFYFKLSKWSANCERDFISPSTAIDLIKTLRLHQLFDIMLTEKDEYQNPQENDYSSSESLKDSLHILSCVETSE